MTDIYSFTEEEKETINYLKQIVTVKNNITAIKLKNTIIPRLNINFLFKIVKIMLLFSVFIYFSLKDL